MLKQNYLSAPQSLLRTRCAGCSKSTKSNHSFKSKQLKHSCGLRGGAKAVSHFQVSPSAPRLRTAAGESTSACGES
ncbi:unnamed protein product [Mycena citricolor]|uniref:Uncharacterized protein n=1 Tax=Mycena citricolor TaxID=2018698 RepID=A0AAD2HCJ3_9AGAR|nr:unnamed protein product [Mycena citricolor]CAK5273090.1 unnamed protein product [Mycena citricolor]CAK5273097.1 unnamed protein product [Mycena citricolor]CAK5273228.1 unnamed protein product [Mycena citricolor]CAK5273263.1 unnamed protein product [Mycena citricolor]